MTAKTRLRLGDGQALEVAACPAAERPLLLFPSIGEYLAYDDQAYDGFMVASQRNAAYRQALRVASPGRVVLDIGTGRDALWAITAARAGARQVYAVEAQATVTAQAERAVRRAGLASLVQVITGRSQDVELPRQAGVCVSEIIGNIASAEGALATLADARRRLCAPGCLMVPRRAQTLAAAISWARRPGLQRPPGGLGPRSPREPAPDLRPGRWSVRRAVVLSGPVAGARPTSSAVVEDLTSPDSPDASTRCPAGGPLPGPAARFALAPASAGPRRGRPARAGARLGTAVRTGVRDGVRSSPAIKCRSRSPAGWPRPLPRRWRRGRDRAAKPGLDRRERGYLLQRWPGRKPPTAASSRPWAIQSGRDGHRNARDPAPPGRRVQRSTLLTDSDQPDGENPGDYYTNAITNHYARIVHATATTARVRIPV